METIVQIWGSSMFIIGIFGLGIWFIRTYDDITEGKL